MALSNNKYHTPCDSPAAKGKIRWDLPIQESSYQVPSREGPYTSTLNLNQQDRSYRTPKYPKSGRYLENEGENVNEKPSLRYNRSEKRIVTDNLELQDITNRFPFCSSNSNYQSNKSGKKLTIPSTEEDDLSSKYSKSYSQHARNYQKEKLLEDSKKLIDRFQQLEKKNLSSANSKSKKQLKVDYSKDTMPYPSERQKNKTSITLEEKKQHEEYMKKERSRSGKTIRSSKLSIHDFEVGDCKGEGAFGKVYPARHKVTNMFVALKKVKKEAVKYMMDQFIQELKIQMFLQHPHIVRLYGFFDDETYFYIILEYMDQGSLYSHVKKSKDKKLPQKETKQKMRDICTAVSEIHRHNILHRDIKPQNIVMTHGICKMCDFGWSAICKDRRTTYCGTLDYVSPELIEGEGYDECVDLWGIGVLTYELLEGKTPFYNISKKETMKNIQKCDINMPEDMPQKTKQFIMKLLKRDPECRISAQDLLNEPFLLPE